MKKLFAPLLLILSLGLSLPTLAGAVNSASATSEIKRAEQLERTKGAIYGLKIYKGLIDQNPKNLTALQKGTLASARLVQLQDTRKMQKSFAALTYKYAKMAYNLNRNSAQNNYLMALSKGLMGMYAPLTEKVKYAQEIEKYAKRTIQLDPKHPYIYHLLGRLYFEMSNLSDTEKKLAASVFGKLPDGTYQKALDNMLKCYKLNPGFIVNLSDLGLVYHKLNQDDKARTYLKKAISQKPYYVEDRHIIQEARDLLNVL